MPRKDDIISSLICGTGAGICEALIWTTPSERLKVLQQGAAGTGKAAPGLTTVLKTHGIAGLYVGAAPTAMRQATSVATRFSLVTPIKNFFDDGSGKTNPAVMFMAGGIGGAVSVCINNPIDVIKSKVQSSSDGTTTMKGAFQQTMRDHGPWAFTAGLSARVPRLFLSQAIQFTLVDAVSTFLNNR